LSPDPSAFSGFAATPTLPKRTSRPVARLAFSWVLAMKLAMSKRNFATFCCWRRQRLDQDIEQSLLE